MRKTIHGNNLHILSSKVDDIAQPLGLCSMTATESESKSEVMYLHSAVMHYSFFGVKVAYNVYLMVRRVKILFRSHKIKYPSHLTKLS
jgi:hypothetical protein